MIRYMASRGPPEFVLLMCLFMHRGKLDLFPQVFHVNYFYVVFVFEISD